DAVEVAQSLDQEDLAVEALEGGIQLEEQHVRVTQNSRRSLRLAPLAAQLDLVRRCVVLHLLARGVVIAPRRHYRRLPDPMPAAEGGQRRVRQVRSTDQQLFLDPYQIALAQRQQFQNLLPVGIAYLRPRQRRHLRRTGLQHFAHCQPADLQHPRYLALAHLLRIQFQNRGSLALTQHPPLLVGVGWVRLRWVDGGSLPPDGQAHPAPDGSCCASQRT